MSGSFEIGDLVYSYRFKAIGMITTLFPSSRWPEKAVSTWANVELYTGGTKRANVEVADLRPLTDREKAVFAAAQALGVT